VLLAVSSCVICLIAFTTRPCAYSSVQCDVTISVCLSARHTLGLCRHDLCITGAQINSVKWNRGVGLMVFRNVLQKQERDCLMHFVWLANTLLKDGESARNNHVLACNFCQIFTDFRLFFTRRLSNKPFLIWLQTTPPHLNCVATLPCNLSLMACFADINVSQGSVATRARCGGIFNIRLTANLLRNLPVKGFLKSVKNWQNYGHESVAPFFGPPCIVACACVLLSMLFSAAWQAGSELKTGKEAVPTSTSPVCVEHHASLAA